MNIITDNGNFSISVDEIAEIDCDFNKEEARLTMADGTVHRVIGLPDEKPKASELRKILMLLLEQPKSRAAFIDAIVDDIIPNG